MPCTLVVVALLAEAIMAANATATAGDGTPDKRPVCSTAKCGKGSCSEVAGPIPPFTASYKCTCDSGWYKQKLDDHTVLAFAPCVIPNCSFSSACFNLVTPIPPGTPLTDSCLTVNCGQGGDCETGVGFSYQCRCRPGFKNLLDDPSMPCIGGSSCTFGADCAKLGLASTPPAAASATVGK